MKQIVLDKYSASGNDFLIFHTLAQMDYKKLAIELCHRQNGIGADGMVVILPAEDKKLAYKWQFYNSDGSIANMCGNASRCVGMYAYSHNIAPKDHSFLSGSGTIHIKNLENGIIQSNIGVCKKKDSGINQWHFCELGVPHLVYFASSKDEMENFDTKKIVDLREKMNANVNIAFVQDRKTIFVKTYERGVEGFTLACGTGMGASVAFGNELGMLDKFANAIPQSGEVLEYEVSENGIYFSAVVHKIATCIVDKNLGEF